MDTLIDDLKSGNVEIRRQAIERAVHSADDEIVDRLIQLLQHSGIGQDSREAAAVALAQMSDGRGRAYLLELICSDDSGLRGVAAVGLGQLKTAHQPPILPGKARGDPGTVDGVDAHQSVKV